MMRCAVLGWGLVLRAMVWPLVLALATLTAAEASEAKLAGVAVAAERFGARIRD